MKNWIIKHKILTAIILYLLIAMINNSINKANTKELNISITPSIIAHSQTGTISIGPTKSQAQQQKEVLVKKQVDEQIAAYKTKIIPLIQQFKTENEIVGGLGSPIVYGSNTSYVEAADIYGKLQDQLQQLESNKEVPGLYSDYHAFFGILVDTMKIAMDDIVNPMAREGYNQISTCADEASAVIPGYLEPIHLENLKPFKMSDQIFPGAAFTYQEMVDTSTHFAMNIGENPILFQEGSSNSCGALNHF